jgi:hypothetical protein
MSNPIVAKCNELHAEGYRISAVSISLAGRGTLRVSISRPTFVPLGEGGKMPMHNVTISSADMPESVTLQGRDRCEDYIFELPGNAEQAEALIHGCAAIGLSLDVARFEGDTPDYPHWLTKPNKWMK